MKLNGVAIIAPSSGSGKTSFTLALLQHWQDRVLPFKVGPDFIDPLFHQAVCGVESLNLDLLLMGRDGVRRRVAERWRQEMTPAGASALDRLLLVEGVMGYYDGCELGSSSYDLCAALGLPALLLLPAAGSYSTLPAIAKGLRDFRPQSHIAGVVVNFVGSATHYARIERAFARECPDLPLLGWIAKQSAGFSLPSRHLGLDTSSLDKTAQSDLSALLEHIDLVRLEAIARFELPDVANTSAAPPAPASREVPFPFEKIEANSRLAILHDRAFAFLYPENRRHLSRLFGGRVVELSALADMEIPESVTHIYLPGGYVETSENYRQLAAADRFRASLLSRRAAGAEIFAECAGLLYLGRSVTASSGERLKMSGLLPIDFQMERRFVRLGYYRSRAHGLCGHAFHYSRPLHVDADADPWIWLDKVVEPESAAAPSLTPVGESQNDAETIGGWRSADRRVRGLYLHTFFGENSGCRRIELNSDGE